MKIFKALIYIILPVLIFASFVVLQVLNHQRNSLPVYGVAPDFSLIEKSGNTLRREDLKGQVWVADFIFTRCAIQCPMMSTQLAAMQKELKQVKFVSFSVDPEFDTPSVLSRYAERYQAENQRWFFLTGEREQLNRVAVGFHMNKIDDPMFHSLSFVLVDREGRVRGYYNAGDAEKVESLKRDIKILTK